MTNASNGMVPDALETASTSSSRTLVDEADEEARRSTDKARGSASSPNARVKNPRTGMGHSDGPVGGSGPEVAKPADLSEHESSREAGEAEAQKKNSTSDDVKMEDAAEPQTVDQKVLTALEHQKRSSGTDQQDVEEVMGSILNRLQAAIRPSFIDEPSGIQLEKIMETFFVTTINYTKKFDEKTYQQEVSFDRSITAFPAPEGPCSLYEALGRNFDQQIIEESKLSRYTAVKTLPPVLHVLIQRSQSMGSKNGNPVVIPETLYMDRYMDAPHDSPEFRQRVKNWVVSGRIADLKSQKAKTVADVPTTRFLDEYDPAEDFKPLVPRFTDEVVAGDSMFATPDVWDFDGAVDDDFVIVQKPSEQSVIARDMPKGPKHVGELEKELNGMLDEELALREKALEEHYSGLKNIPYRIHAVICHRGQLMSGHYWVWIHDFEQGVWRKYNDSRVEVSESTVDVLQSLSTSGEPYYLCYVQDEGKNDYVNVPKRLVPNPPQDGAENTPDVDADGDVQVTNHEVVSTGKVTGTEEELPPYSAVPVD